MECAHPSSSVGKGGARTPSGKAATPLRRRVVVRVTRCRSASTRVAGEVRLQTRDRSTAARYGSAQSHGFGSNIDVLMSSRNQPPLSRRPTCRTPFGQGRLLELHVARQFSSPNGSAQVMLHCGGAFRSQLHRLGHVGHRQQVMVRDPARPRPAQVVGDERCVHAVGESGQAVEYGADGGSGPSSSSRRRGARSGSALESVEVVARGPGIARKFSLMISK